MAIIFRTEDETKWGSGKGSNLNSGGGRWKFLGTAFTPDGDGR